MMNIATRHGRGRERSDEGTCRRIVRLGKFRGYWFAALIALANVGCPSAMSVSRHVSTNLPESRVGEIFTDSWTVLSTNDPPDDVSCNVPALQKARSIRTVEVFNAGSGTINIPDDLEAVDGQSGFVRVVNEINWCDGFISVRGCSRRPGSHIVVTRHDNLDLEGQLWAHEYGHTRGNRDVAEPTRIMNSYTVATARRVTSSECDKFKKE